MTLNRRHFLGRSAAVASGAVFTLPTVQAITAHPAWAAQQPGGGPGGRGGNPVASGYGRVRRAPDQNGEYILALPAGFQYTTFSKTLDPMSDGNLVPRNHDGMGCFPGPEPGTVVLVRNHEVRNAPQTTPPRTGAGDVAGPDATKYDVRGVAGTTNLVYDLRRKRLVTDFISQNGSIVNCAGGIGRGGTGWLTCEETVAGPNQGWGQRHGYTFYVPATGTPGVTTAVPLRAMGRFSHEANATDPSTGIVYQTEDAGNDSGFYRFVPSAPDLSAGTLQMLRVVGQPGYDTRTRQQPGVALPADWVTIADPDPDLEAGATTCFAQGFQQGGARFNRLEGIWWGVGAIWFVSTTGGNVQNGDGGEGYGQIWRYDPAASTLTLFYESPGGDLLDSPDNLTVTPRGSLLLCEDDASDANLGFIDETDLNPDLGTDINRLIGISPRGEAFTFAVNIYNTSEFAGACFSPDGSTLFVNLFGGSDARSGMTCAITGPFPRGPF